MVSPALAGACSGSTAFTGAGVIASVYTPKRLPLVAALVDSNVILLDLDLTAKPARFFSWSGPEVPRTGFQVILLPLVLSTRMFLLFITMLSMVLLALISEKVSFAPVLPTTSISLGCITSLRSQGVPSVYLSSTVTFALIA